MSYRIQQKLSLRQLNEQLIAGTFTERYSTVYYCMNRIVSIFFRTIVKKRTELEYKLQRRVVEKKDFLKYLEVCIDYVVLA